MRQFTAATVLLAVLSLCGAPVVAALSTGSPEDNVPVCCRRNGKHHCMMQKVSEPGSGPVFTAPPQHCPLYPKAVLPGTTRLSVLIPAPGARFFAAVQSHPVLVAQTEAR
jgi:hypothetical protein